MQDLQKVINGAWDDRAAITPANAKAEVREAVDETIDLLDGGKLRVAEKSGGGWVTNEWAKKAVLLSFRLKDNELLADGYSRYFDKVPSKFADYTAETFQKGGFIFFEHGQADLRPCHDPGTTSDFCPRMLDKPFFQTR